MAFGSRHWGYTGFTWVIGLELMAQTLQSVYHSQQISGINDVQFHRPVKFHRDQAVDIEIVVDINEPTAQCTLYSIRELAGGRIQKTKHFEANMQVTATQQHKLLREEPVQEVALNNEDIYKVFFHGPSFQVMDTDNFAKELLMDCMMITKVLDPTIRRPLNDRIRFSNTRMAALSQHQNRSASAIDGVESIKSRQIGKESWYELSSNQPLIYL